MKKATPKTYKVLLSFFEDDANGEFGLAHANSIKEGFNAFWTGQGIFHDVFEHYFENISQYFKGKYAFNIGGEICAMGHLTYYYYCLGLHNRPLGSGFYGMEYSIAHTTIDNMKEAIMDGYISFGSRLECAVPKQKRANNHSLDSIITEHQFCMENCVVNDNADERDAAITFKRSVTPNKIEKLYIYGYNSAEQIAPNTEHNKKTLSDFIDYWNYFCRNHSAKELTSYFKHLEFEITTGKELQWTATFIAHDGTRVDCKEVKELLYA